MYHEINETAARRAKEANSYSDYKQGSKTSEYRSMIDAAREIVERQKQRVDPMHHDKIDRLFGRYCAKLAANMNKGFEIDARVPSIMIAGPSNFPVRKKEKQNAARHRNMEDFQEVQGILEKIKGVGMGGISADDPNAIKKLEDKLASLENSQETMKAVNVYYRKNGTLDSCPDLSEDTIEKLKASMSRDWRKNPKPFESFSLSNNSAEIRRLRKRIEGLKRHAESSADGWAFDGGEVVINKEANRLQIKFDGKPDEAVRNELKSNGFRWAPSQGAWQRQLTTNAMFAIKRIKAIAPSAENENVTGARSDGYTSVMDAIQKDKVKTVDTSSPSQDAPSKTKKDLEGR